MKCLVCEKLGKIVEFEKACSLGTHLWKTHDLKPQQYYDQYLANPGDGKCAECGAPTSFRTIGQGYKEWDGQVASTLPKIVKCIGNVCPAILEEKFDRKKCSTQLDEFFGK